MVNEASKLKDANIPDTSFSEFHQTQMNPFRGSPNESDVESVTTEQFMQ